MPVLDFSDRAVTEEELPDFSARATAEDVPDYSDRAVVEETPSVPAPEPESRQFIFDAEAEYPAPDTETLKQFFEESQKSLISLPRFGPTPSAPEDASLIQKTVATGKQIGAGLAESGAEMGEALATPLTAGIVAASAVPVVGKPFAIAAGAGFGSHMVLEGFKHFSEAIESGDVRGASKALGNIAVGTFMVGHGMKSAKTAQTPLPITQGTVKEMGAEPTKGEPSADTIKSAIPSVRGETPEAPSQVAGGVPGEVQLAPGAREISPEARPQERAGAVAPKKELVRDVTTPEGPGAMTPAELAPVKEMTTSDKLRIMDQRREELGLPKQDPVLRYTNKQALEDAKARLDEDQGWLDTLVNELREKPRSVYPHEEAALNIRRAELNVELERSLKNWKEAFESDQYERAAYEGQNVDRWRKAVDDMDSITGRGGTGTEAGRSLQARKMALDEEFRLARMDMEMRQAKGEDLTPEETKKVVDLNETIQRTEREFIDRVGKFEEGQSEAAAQETLKSHLKRPKPKVTPKPEDLAAEKADLLEGIKEAPEDINRYIKELADNLIEGGIKDLEPLAIAIQKELRSIDIEMSLRDIKDAYSDYGKSTPATTDPIKIVKAQLRREAQLESALEDIIEKQQAPLATGQRRVGQSERSRRLTAQINEAKKKYNIQATDPIRQLKSTLDSIRTRLDNAIKDIQFEISTGKKIIRTKNVVPSDADIAAKRAQLAELRAIKAEMFPKEPLTPEQLKARALKGAERSEAYWNERLAEAKKGNFATPGKPAKFTDAAVQSVEARRNAAKEAFQELKDIANPKKTPEQIALQALKTRLANSTADLKDRLARGDFEPKPKKAPPDISKDPEAMRIKAENELAKQEFKRGLEKYQFQKKSIFQKAGHYIGNVVDLSRTLMTTGEFSFILRQGKAAFFSRPLTAIRAIPNMLRAMKSEQKALEMDMQVLKHPDYTASQNAKLFIMKEGQGVLNKSEEILMGRWSNVIPVVKSFNRAARVFLNKLRFDNWLAMRKSMSKAGIPTQANDKLIALYVNEATGRGGLGKYGEPAAVLLNRAFFSPRYVASRLQYVAGHALWSGMFSGGMKGTLPARKAIAKEYARTLIGAGLYYGMLKWYFTHEDKRPPTIEIDPRSSDLMDVRINDTRIDPLTGISQLATFTGRTITLETKTGKGAIRSLHGKRSVPGQRWSDVAARFAWSKSHPAISKVKNMLDGYDLVGNVTTPEGEALTVGPMTWVDIYVALKEHDIEDGLAMALLGYLGDGIQTHGPKKK